jgi:hypothetical protein
MFYHWSDGVAYFAEVASATKAKLEYWSTGDLVLGVENFWDKIRIG